MPIKVRGKWGATEHRCGWIWWLIVRILVVSAFETSLLESALAGQSGTEVALQGNSLAELEEQLAEIDARLAQLASFSLRSGVGAIGYRSHPNPEASHKEWILIELAKEESIDQIVLVPVIWRDTRTGFRADGFPIAFRLIAESQSNPEGKVIATFDSGRETLPRMAPLVISCPPDTKASRIRLEVTELSPRAWDGGHLLQLSEILLFDGEENVALGQEVRIPAFSSNENHIWSKEALVDGYLPYLMDAAPGEQSLALVSKIGLSDPPVLTIDLGKVQPLNRIHLHRTELSDNVPQAAPSDFGIPGRLLIEGAEQSDFSDGKILVDFRKNSIYDAGPILMWRFPEAHCRYVRLTGEKPYLDVPGDEATSIFGSAEIELFSDGQNVAINHVAQANFSVISPERTMAALTDGLNLYGEILPLREWMSQLAERHDLNVERPLVFAELSRRYNNQKTNLKRMGWLAVTLSVGIIVTFLIGRIIRMRQGSKIRERIAADLHDELGANLHTIGLLSDLAGDDRNTPEELAKLHRRIRSETERSGTAVRHCADLLLAEELYTNLVADMKRASRRIMAKLTHELSIEGEEYLAQLDPRIRADLFLFYKECLVNISRHSGATHFTTQLTAGPKLVHLTISDNGQGLPSTAEDDIPSSLMRRARLLGARVAVDSPNDGGMRVKLMLRTRKWGIRM